MMLLDKLQAYNVVLASQSPRRQELLAGMGVTFSVLKCDEPERIQSDWTPDEVVRQLAWQKASSVFKTLAHQPLEAGKPYLVIGGDTIVVVDGHILGKPSDRCEAERMLRLLSGRSHEVYSGLCVKRDGRELLACDSAVVTFDELGVEEICYYIDHCRPFDKAGSYGVQEWIGYRGITKLDGSFYTVMGLPTHLLWQMLLNVV